MGAANGLFARLRDVFCPVLVVCGGTSQSIPPSLGARIVERLPNGRLEVWDANGHFGPLEDPGCAVESMLAFTNA
jgi:pimeloyl-ACP methyl ester carboxylesterase